MGLLIIDAEKCKRDGFCVRDCPTAIIRLPEKGVPEIIPGGEATCLDCGHCVAVCPHDALSHKRIPIEKSPPVREELRISEAQVVQFLRMRRSVRHFLDRKVEREKIRKLIEIARYAPTGGNSQMVEWVVLDDKARIREIAGLTVNWLRELIKNPQVVAASPYLPVTVASWDAGNDSVLRDAPALVIAMAPREAMNGLVDLTLALSYLDLFASALDLGTCWAGLLQGTMINSPAVKAAAGVPESYPHHYPMMVGYPEFKFHRLPERKEPKIMFA
ncbi:MAG: nitroreductase family protein [Acidobacteria bacterium]|nr:nitroreductase family protein [Acidobacteriota bacterium]